MYMVLGNLRPGTLSAAVEANGRLEREILRSGQRLRVYGAGREVHQYTRR